MSSQLPNPILNPESSPPVLYYHKTTNLNTPGSYFPRNSPADSRSKITPTETSPLANKPEPLLLRGIKKILRIPQLLLFGYADEVSRRKYEVQEDWPRFHATMLRKLENIGIVSGLLLASNTNLLVSGDLRRMTYTTVTASIYCSLLSIIFGLLCLWSLSGVHPTRLRYLVRRTSLFYYLYGTPSLFGGASALSFFVAVGSWTWLDEATAMQGWGGKICTIAISACLAGNAFVCFYLGGSTRTPPELCVDEESPKVDTRAANSIGIPVISMPVPGIALQVPNATDHSLTANNTQTNEIIEVEISEAWPFIAPAVRIEMNTRNAGNQNTDSETPTSVRRRHTIY